MSSEDKPPVGTIAWRDLTVADADGVQKFYSQVVGWEVKPTSMGEYNDYSMIAPGNGETVAGVCHARGVNAGLPPQWLIYIVVEDVDASAKRCVECGGRVLHGPRASDGGKLCVIEDPAGAVAALYET